MKKTLPGIAAAMLLAMQLVHPGFAQTAPVQTAPAETKTADVPWLYEGSDIPVDESWTFGELANGLRYAVKKNDVPAGQVAIRVRIDAGSLYERDDERGYAHLIEHLAFRGSEYVPDGESKRIWQRFGVFFGSDSNAQTTPTQTVYKLDLPNSSPEKLDESVKILAGMMRAPSITKKALTAERAIVLAEMRESSGARSEMGDALRAHFFKGQAYANRSPIGTPETLNASTAEGLRAFHQRWYRPDKTVIVIAGDAEAEILEAQIKTHFGNWKTKGVSARQPDFGKPKADDDKENKAAIFVEPTLPLAATIAWVKPWHQVNDTIVYNEQLIIDALALQIINRRLQAQARSSSSFLFAEVGANDISRSAEITTLTLRPLGDDWEAAVKDVRAIIADAIATAPSKVDIDREKALLERVFTTRVDSYAFEAAAKQADGIVNAVDIRETVASPQTALDVFRNMDSKFTSKRVHSSTRKLFASNVVRIFLSSPKDMKSGKVRLAGALNVNVAGNTGVRLAQDKPEMDDLPALGKAEKPIGRTKLSGYGMELLKFENGTRALLFPNKAEVGQIRMVVRFGKGYQAIAPKDAALLWTGPIVLNENGIGKFSQTQIEQMVNGRRIQLGFDVGNNAFEYSATTSTKDLADQLKLIAVKMEHPGWDEGPVARAKAFVKSGYDTFQTSADAVLQRDLEYLLSGSDKRWKFPTPAEAAKITPKAVRSFWEPLLKTGPVEVILMGDFDSNAAVEALSQSFAAMKPRRTAQPSPAALKLSFPSPNSVPLQRIHNGPANQAAAAIAWPTAGGLARIKESRELEVLAAIFRDRLFEKFRSEQAASYSPSMANSWPEEFTSGGYLMAISQVQPKDIDRFFKFAEEVAADLAANPVSDDELKRAVEPLRQMIDRLASGNTFWLNNLKGATYDQQRFSAFRSMFRDFEGVTAPRLQELAKRYFVNSKAWKLEVLPARASKGNSAPAASR
ncbi:MAG: insulinase family protein [Sphingorhabdus sp.]